jgi:SAM-dependent methyltransferase
MDTDTIRRLNAINREFYRITAAEFDQTRGAAWPGWARLLPHLKLPLAVLDVGCGNGRFGVFLREHLGGEQPLRYHGLDNNPALLERARAALPEATFELCDVIENPPESGQYDLVALLGVLHHIPGYAARRAFMRGLAERVAPGGLLVFTAWRFYEYPRFRERIVPWPPDMPVEPGDYLLDWRRGERALRYCHYVDDAEHAALVAATGLREIATYRADGQTGDANRYSLLRR